MKRVAFCTFGCRLNQYDTETIRTLLERDGGYRAVRSRDEADVYVVNTCSVTARADATARKAIRRIHAEHPAARIVVTGCYAQRAPDELAGLPGVSLVLGAADRARVAARIDALRPGPAEVAVSPVSEARTFIDVPITEMMEHSRAYVKVQEGCNESCTFCIVPQTRGRSRSRRPESVLEQVRRLVGAGYVEIVLTGVHLGDYGLDLGGEGTRLAALLRAVLDVPGLERFRLSSIEPASVSDEIIGLMADEPRFARHFHVPFQSGSDAVLRRMNRRYSAGEFAALVRRIAARVPGCGIGTDVICGFPGESDEDFRATFDLIEALPVTYLHAFTYSSRPGSAAESFGDQVPPDVRKRRTRSLKRLSDQKNRAFREPFVGDRLSVLVEAGQGTAPGLVSGWSDNYLRVALAPGPVPGRVVDVRITENREDGLVGEAVAVG